MIAISNRCDRRYIAMVDEYYHYMVELVRLTDPAAFLSSGTAAFAAAAAARG